ncbi:hypothetical protein LR003_03340 [candidate division NPL-UPA2 bacterium]|nr:hypothetical protein [candidate division NPL-UPA2 bacterium]
MQLLVLVINQEEYLDEILSAFVEVGISGATIVDSVGMGRILAHDIPIFAGLRHLLEGNRPYNKTIFAVVNDDKKVEEAITVFEEICGSLDKPGTGFLFTLPVTRAKGLAREF